MSDPNEKTRLIRRTPNPEGGAQPSNPSQQSDDPEKTVYVGTNSDEVDDKTRIIQRGSSSAQNQPANTDENKTVLVRRSSKSSALGENTPNDDTAEGPLVGWLVVVEGPGRGKSVALGYGMNSIGRDPGNRVVLDFGDQQISRNKHATVTYDPRGRKFFIQHGDSSNLTYIGDNPVLAPQELNSGELIRLGDSTVVKFVALCGDDFDWE